MGYYESDRPSYVYGIRIHLEICMSTRYGTHYLDSIDMNEKEWKLIATDVADMMGILGASRAGFIKEIAERLERNYKDRANEKLMDTIRGHKLPRYDDYIE